jgi:ATP-dependent Lon protease
MEVLQLSGYTDEEKVQIGLTYLVPKQIAAHGLRPEELTFEPDALRAVIRGYTREAGVRNLDREIATLCRKVAREIAEGRTDPVTLHADEVHRYLGRQRFIDEVAERTTRPGVATGLAWTPTGGDVLFVEATCMPSKNEQLILTGMLGDVMRESAQAALSYIRSYGGSLVGPAGGNGQAPRDGDAGRGVPLCAGLDGRVFEDSTVHVHVPAGAIPKDGPSAGVTMLTALASLATGRPVRSDLAMTGELTLRGKVLPIGGLKEKILAAHRAGIKTVLIPRQNERDLEDVPAVLLQSMEIIPVDTAEEVLDRALEPPVAVPTGKGKTGGKASRGRGAADKTAAKASGR